MGKYNIVLADPPWSYTGQQDKWGAAAKFYPTMTNQELLDFPMMKYLSHRGILFLWATSPKLDFAIECIKAWGLTYRGVGFVWVKTKRDGTPIAAQGVRPSIIKPLTEFVLCASKQETGRPLTLFDEAAVQTIFDDVVFYPKQEHSRKPDLVQDRIDKMYPSSIYSKIELFARRKRDGWDSWGNEVE